jgi:hypothetical protein
MHCSIISIFLALLSLGWCLPLPNWSAMQEQNYLHCTATLMSQLTLIQTATDSMGKVWLFGGSGRAPGVNPQPVTNILFMPDASTRPGVMYYSRTISKGVLWDIGDKSRSIFVKEFLGSSICEMYVNSHCAHYSSSCSRWA